MTWAQALARTNTAVMAVFGSTPATLGWDAVTGDFIEPSDRLYLEGVSATASVPQFQMLSAQVPASVVGKPLVIGGDVQRSFTVVEAKPDGYGMTILMLEAA